MLEFLFRAEGVNLATTVYDTADISTIRGGGFYLLSRVSALARSYKVSLITEGASSAVFKIETGDPKNVRSEMLQLLYATEKGVDEVIPEMMFLVEYIDDDGALPDLMAKLMGKVRMAQMQTPSLRLFPDTLVPGVVKDKKSMAFDELNRVLPAHKRDDTAEKNLSPFTFARRKQGKVLRNNIYKRMLSDEIKSIGQYEFTNNLEDLSDDDKQGNLNGKIAYIHIDGNKFGPLQRDFNMEQYRDYDKKLQGFKNKFLAETIKLAAAYKYKKQVRLETLLWGGDELKLVVPAWLGWRVASLFYDLAETEKMQIEADIGGKPKTCEMTYAMGLVFAHHKNPIRNIDKIAEELTGAVKKALPPPDGDEYPAYRRSTGNRMQYVVLESLETLPSDYASFARSRYGPQSAHQSLAPQDIISLVKFVRMLENHFPRSQLFTIAQFCDAGTTDQYHAALQRAFDVCEATESDKTKLARAIADMTGAVIKNGEVEKSDLAQCFRWRQAAELWDYLTWKED